MKMLCISTFNTWGQMTGLTINKIYEAKWYDRGRIVIKNDLGKFYAYPINNFINNKHITSLSQ